MFPYDPQILGVLSTPPQTIPEVIAAMQAIDTLCDPADGLKWFNWLYLTVTQSVSARVSSITSADPAFSDPVWMASLDVHFAALYFDALRSWLSGSPIPECWKLLFDRRNCLALARIQFALAGINAHINHDLPIAIVNTGSAPVHGDAHYSDYTSLNANFEALVDIAKTTLNVRLLGDALPPAARLEDQLAGFSVTAARETAWTNAEILWSLRPIPLLTARTLTALDGFTSVIAQALLLPV